MLVRFDPLTGGKLTDVRNNDSPGPIAQPTDPTQVELGAIAIGDRNAITSPLYNLADAIARIPQPDDLSRFVDVAPLRVHRTANSYRVADELDLRLSWKDSPFDSRIVRSILVFQYEGTVSPNAFATGKRELNPASTSATGFLVPATGKNLRFMGVVDEMNDEHSPEGDYLTLKARDLTALLLDKQFPTDAQITFRKGATILDVVSAILDSAFPAGGRLIRGPFARPAELADRLPELDAKLYNRLALRAQDRNLVGPSQLANVVHIPSKTEDLSYWDVITDVVVSHGLVPYIDLDRLVIQEPRTYFTGSPERIGSLDGTPTFPTEYRKRIGITDQTRKMVYGFNVSDLRSHRKLGRIKAPAVEVSSVNPDAADASKRRITVLHPPNAKNELLAKKRAQKALAQATQQVDASQKSKFATAQDPTGKSAMEIYRVNVAGITDESILRKVAESIYESMGRNEVGVTFRTNDMASFVDYTRHPNFDPNEDPDLLDLRAGDPVQLVVTPSSRTVGALFSISELNRLVAQARSVQASRKAAGLVDGGLPLTSAVDYLADHGFSRSDAKQLVKILSAANLPDVFRVSTVEFTYDMEGGDFEIAVDMRDYLRVRSDPSDPTTTGGVGNPTPGGITVREPQFP